MYLSIDSSGSVALNDADDCTSFSVSGTRPSSTVALDAVRSVGVDPTDDGAHCWVDPAFVVSRAGGDIAADWADRFAAMVGYATSKGWVDETGRLRAHCTWDGDDQT